MWHIEHSRVITIYIHMYSMVHVMIACSFQANYELWLAFGTGREFHYLLAHQLHATFGPDKSCTHSMFHAFTGHSAVSSSAGDGKITAWATWNSQPGLPGTHSLGYLELTAWATWNSQPVLPGTHIIAMY